MIIVSLWLMVMVLTAVSWVVLTLIGRPQHVGFILLFWMVSILGTTALLYLISVWFVAA